MYPTLRVLYNLFHNIKNIFTKNAPEFLVIFLAITYAAIENISTIKILKVIER